MIPLFVYEYGTSTLVVMLGENVERHPLSVKEANQYALETYGVPVNFAEIETNPQEQE